MRDHVTRGVLFPELLSKPTHVAFDAPASTSDGGALLLKAVDERLGLTEALASGVRDTRQPGKVRHRMGDLLRQRVFDIALGYVDANDAARTADDPMHRLLLDRDPLRGEALASQPTLCRFENQASRTDLLRMSWALCESVVDYHARRLHRKKVRRITIDLDLTHDLTHGSQEQSLFNGHYGGYCYLPLLGFLTFGDEPDQYLFAAMLRPGAAAAVPETTALLARIVPQLRGAFPNARIRVRLDGGFAGPALLEFLEDLRVEYVIALGKNSVLEARSASLVRIARRSAKRTKQSQRCYGETRYAAHTWRKKKRRVVIKAEVVCLEGREPRDNARFVVTNLSLKPESVYATYCKRGEIENRIKELQHDLEIDRTSCHRFAANQFRVLMTAAAYVMFQVLRSRLARVGVQDLARAQVGTMRLALLKIGGRIERSVRRFTVHLAASHPWRDRWRRAAFAWGASAR